MPVVPVDFCFAAEAALRVNDQMHLQASTSEPCAAYGEIRAGYFTEPENIAVERE